MLDLKKNGVNIAGSSEDSAVGCAYYPARVRRRERRPEPRRTMPMMHEDERDMKLDAHEGERLGKAVNITTMMKISQTYCFPDRGDGVLESVALIVVFGE